MKTRKRITKREFAGSSVIYNGKPVLVKINESKSDKAKRCLSVLFGDN